MKKIGTLAGLVVTLILLSWLFVRMADEGNKIDMADLPLPNPCRDIVFETNGYIVCAINLGGYDVALRRSDSAGKPWRSLEALDKAEPFTFAMNAGMYHEDMSPVGLYVEDGVEHTPLNLEDAEGNFFLKPNGVFYVDRAGRAGVQETAAFAAAKPQVVQATQSGPMLVIDGAIHPRFEANGTSRYVRNGVGVDASGKAVFAISRTKVSLGSFARLFRDMLQCPNALFFDGGISAFHDGKKYLVGGDFPVGPIVKVTEKASAPGA